MKGKTMLKITAAKYLQVFGRAKRPELMFKTEHVPTAKEKLILLMAEIGAAQETYKEELMVCGIQYPLNAAIFCLSNAVLAIKKKEENMFLKITKNGTEFKRDIPSMRHANEIIQAVMQELPEGMPKAYDGQKLIVGNEAQGIAETVYRIENAA